MPCGDFLFWASSFKQNLAMGFLIPAVLFGGRSDAVAAFNLLMGRKRLAGSAIGGIRETQEMLDFCAANDIVADVEVIPIQKINTAYERLLKSDVKYRFSIDMASLKQA